MVSTILVPTDGSKIAKNAAKYAIDLAKQLKATIVVLGVIDKRSLMISAMPAASNIHHVIEPLDDYLREMAEMSAKEITVLCEKNAVKSKVVITTGHPAEEIIKTATKFKVGLIIMGSRGESALAATVLGSTTYGVIHNDTKIPVLVVR